MSVIVELKRITALTLLTGLVGCGTAPQTNSPTTAPNASTASPAASIGDSGSNRPQVVATTTVVCDLTKQIAGNTVDLKCLIDSGSDPHIYEPKPEDSKAIEQAKLILYGGYNFEPSLIKLIKATSNPAPKVAVDELAVPKPQQFEEDGKTVTDPHVWHNAQNGLRMAEVISENLTKLEPNNAQLYTENTKKLTTEISQIDLRGRQ